MPPAPDAPLFQPQAERLRRWLFDEALPFWAERGLDAVHGGFHERLDLQGAPDLAAARRLRVQARQIYAFSHAHILGWRGPALDIVEAGYEFLTHKGWLAEGGWLHLLTPQGGVPDDRRDTYDHAFVAFALAFAHRALGRHDPLTWAERTLAFVDAELADGAHGGYLESLPPATPRRQNPHMHMLEAALALYEATGEETHLARARAMVDLFRQRFFDPSRGALREFMDADWSPLASDIGLLTEPGHHYEWVWLLSEYAGATGELVGEYCERLFAFAETSGCDQSGFAYDLVRSDGAVVKASRRLWPQTEALKACAALRRAGRTDLDARIAALVDGVFDQYLTPAVPGGWIDQCGPDGAPVAAHIPASILYHLVSAYAALAEALADGAGAPSTP